MITCEVNSERDGLGGWTVAAVIPSPDGVILVDRFCGGDAEKRAREYAEWMNSRYRDRAESEV